MINVQSLTKHFGDFTAVNRIDFEVEAGEILGFLGPNGAGKSTTMKMITGFLSPSYGTAFVGGIDVTKNPKAAQAKIGYLPESAPSYKAMTVVEFLRFIAEVRGLSNSEIRSRIDAVVDQTQLEAVLFQTIDTLSKGYRQRVGFAQALIHDPPILILDEPTDGLDPNQKFEVRKLIKAMAEKKAIVLSTHILEEMEAVCTRAIIIDKGKIVADAKPEVLMSKSKMHRAAEFALNEPLTDQESRELFSIEGVKKVEEIKTNKNETRYLLYPAEGANLLKPLQEKFKAFGKEPHEIFLHQGHMDEVFRKLTLGEQLL